MHLGLDVGRITQELSLAIGRYFSQPESWFGERMFDAMLDGAVSVCGESSHELVTSVSDAESGLEAIIAIHSSARGPAFGGCRYWYYPDRESAIQDAKRLSEGMSLKNALADLPFGGGKAVILRNKQQHDREALFKAFGRFVASQKSRYITAEDVGTTVGDMQAVATQTRYVSGLSGEGRHGGNPSPLTALGVFLSIRKGVQLILKRSDLDGVVVAVQGLGSVGWELCHRLAGAGCKLVVSDLNQAVVERAVQSLGATRCATDQILFADAQVLAPCALGGVLNPESLPGIKAKIIAGAANNQLLTSADGDALHDRGIYYLPDYLVNAGGIISVAREYLSGAGHRTIVDEVHKIADRVEELVDRAQHSGEAPARVADQWARSLLQVRRHCDLS